MLISAYLKSAEQSNLIQVKRSRFHARKRLLFTTLQCSALSGICTRSRGTGGGRHAVDGEECVGHYLRCLSSRHVVARSEVRPLCRITRLHLQGAGVDVACAAVVPVYHPSS